MGNGSKGAPAIDRLSSPFPFVSTFGISCARGLRPQAGASHQQCCPPREVSTYFHKKTAMCAPRGMYSECQVRSNYGSSCPRRGVLRKCWQPPLQGMRLDLSGCNDPRATALTAERILPLRPRWTPVSGQYGAVGREGQCRKRAAQAHCLVSTEECLIRVGAQVPWLGWQGLPIHGVLKSQRCSHKGRPRSKREGPAKRISTGRKE